MPDTHNGRPVWDRCKTDEQHEIVNCLFEFDHLLPTFLTWFLVSLKSSLSESFGRQIFAILYEVSSQCFT